MDPNEKDSSNNLRERLEKLKRGVREFGEGVDKFGKNLDEVKERLERISASLRAIGETGVDTHNTPLPVVAIVGAGASGIIAAHDLLSKGYQVVMIEAHSEMGGRAHTDTSLGVPFDHGCQWLHSDLWEIEAEKSFGIKAESKDQEAIDYFFSEGKFSYEITNQLAHFRTLIEDCFHAVDSGSASDDLADDEEKTPVIIEEKTPKISEEKTSEIAEDFVKETLDAEIEKYIAGKMEIRKGELKSKAKSEIESFLEEEAQARREKAEKRFREGDREAQGFSTKLTDTAIIEIYDEKKKGLKDRLKLSELKKQITGKVNKSPANLADVFSEYDVKYDQAVLEKKTEEKLINLYEDEEKKERQALISEVYNKEVVEELKKAESKLRKEIEEIYVPLVKTQLGCFEESIEFDKFSVVDQCLQDEEKPGCNKDQKVPRNGYGALICSCGKKLLENSNFTLKLNTVVKSITYGGTRVKILTTGESKSEEISADIVIVTASTAVIASGVIEFSPSCVEVIDLFKKLPLGHYKKIGIKFERDIFKTFIEGREKERFDNQKHVYSPVALEMYDRQYFTYVDDTEGRGVWKIQMPLPGSNVVLMIASGSFAKWLDETYKGDEAGAVKYALDQLSAMLGKDLVEKNFNMTMENYSMSNWGTDPFVRGAYSYTAEGGGGARETLKDVFLKDQVLFAGEALHLNGYGSAQAALLSGRYAAEKAIKKLGEKTS